MAGRFTNTNYNGIVDSLLGTMQDAIKNNYYKYSDKPPTPVEYFHINKEASTLDEGSRLAFNNVGDNSPFWYNKINNIMLYGLDQISMTYSYEDFGQESAPIEGEAVVLPNTIKPYPDDQFCIKYLNKQVIFKVTHVDPDTLEDGSNVYRINYRSSADKYTDLLKQVIDEYEFIIENVGTELNPILKSSTRVFIEDIDKTLLSLKGYFKNIFYNKRVQTFIYSFLEKNFYDPYMIEFIRKNKLLEGDGDFIYIQHQTTLEPLFAMNYMKTFMYCLENKDVDHVDKYHILGAGKLIEDKFSIFINRLEDYWQVFYDYPIGYEFLYKIPCFSQVLSDHISNYRLIEKNYTFYNIIIKYMFDLDITKKDIDDIDNIDYENSVTMFYAIPCIIYCLEQYVNKLLKVETDVQKHNNNA